MRWLTLICAISTSMINGCSCLIANCEKDLGAMNDRNQVRQEFGRPLAIGEENGKEYEEFRSHWKVKDSYFGTTYGMGIAMTAGLYEFLAFPLQVWKAIRATVAGQDIRFYYDQNGRVRKCTINGDEQYIKRHPEPNE